MRRLFLWDQNVAKQIGATGAWGPGEESVIYTSPGGKHGLVMAVAYSDDNKPFLFDGMLRLEYPGAVFLPVNQNGHVGLQQQWRPQVIDVAAYKASYPTIDPHNIGRLSWEIPRGYGLKGETWQMTAQREAESETRKRVLHLEGLYVGNDNTALSAHPTFMSYGDVSNDPTDIPDDPFEPIYKRLQWFSQADVLRLICAGELYCNYTLAALAVFGMKFPGKLK